MAKNRKAKTNDQNALQMTQSAYDELVRELEHRKTTLRKEIADEISAARELGDLSENHAYTVAMEKKEMNENRILEIEDILAIVEIVNESVEDDTVNVGDTVEILNVESNEKRIVTLVGSEETKAANPLEGKISVDSPIGKALHNAKIGESVDIVLPMKTTTYKILGYAKAE